MKVICSLILSAIFVLDSVYDAEAQTLRQISGYNGLYGIEIVDNITGKVKVALPAMFQNVIFPQNTDDLVVAKIADGTFIALDTSLNTVFPFPNTVNEVYGFEGGMCIFKGRGYDKNYGAIDDYGNIMLKDCDFVGHIENNGIVGFRGIRNYSSKNLWRSEYYEVHRITADKSKCESFTLYIPHLRSCMSRPVQNPKYHLAILSSADSISQYTAEPLDNMIAQGLCNMINGDYSRAKKYFRKALRASGDEKELSTVLNYNLIVSEVMSTGRICRLPQRDNLEEFHIDAAIAGLYGQNIAECFKAYYELPLLCTNRSSLKESVSYNEYSYKLYYDRNLLNPLKSSSDDLYKELLDRRNAFVLSESMEQISYDKLSAMIVDVESNGSSLFCTYDGNKYPDSRLSLSYYLDIRLFMMSIMEEYNLTELTMTFPY